MKLAIIGAGGVRTPLLIQSLYKRQTRLGIEQLYLMDIDPIRLNTISAVTHQLENSGKLDFKITRTGDLKEALTGADFVITTFRAGGIESRVIDERVPLKLGLLGQETTGAGGFAMGLRGIPVLIDIVHDMEKVCPHAWLVNFTNPAGMMIQALQDVTGWKRMAGICDAPSQFLFVFAGLLQAKMDEVELDYFGLNHLGWIRSVRHRGEDHIQEFIEMLVETGGFQRFPFDPDLIKAIGMIPNEYLFYYYYSRQAVANIKKAAKTRGEQILGDNQIFFKKIIDLIGEENYSDIEKTYLNYLINRGGSYMQNETGGAKAPENPVLIEQLEQLDQPANEGYAGVALDLIESLLGKCDRRMILNIPNRTSIPAMGRNDIVEISNNVSKDEIIPIDVDAIPDNCLGLMKIIKNFEHLTIEAAVEGSYTKALQALTIHPLVQDYQLARKVLDGYIKQHGVYFPRLI
jgi:6-phospho-beta-glucosidase